MKTKHIKVKRIKAYPIKSVELCARCGEQCDKVYINGIPICTGYKVCSSVRQGEACKYFKRAFGSVHINNNTIDFKDNEGNVITHFEG